MKRKEEDREDRETKVFSGLSMEEKNKALIEIPARSENIGFVRVAVASFASQLDFTLGELEEIKVAVSEGVSNAIIHAYGEEEGQITIHITIHGDLLTITITDYGMGMVETTEAFTPSFTTAGRMGLGLVFIESFMDSARLTSPPGGGTTLIMEKRPQKDQEWNDEGD